MQDRENQAWLTALKFAGMLYEGCVALSVGLTCLAGGIIIHSLLKRRR